MKVKKQGAINKQDLEVKDGPVSGTVTAVAKGAETSYAAHAWEYSIDGGVTWIHLDPTLAATTDILSGIGAGDTVTVRHRYIYATGPTSYVTSEPFVVR